MVISNQYFRANVGILILRANGDVLVFERSDIPRAWQVPQGGLKQSEEPLEAAQRELQEETGIALSSLKTVGEISKWLAYELPESARSQKTGRGQVQKWSLFLTNTDEVEPNLAATDGEFRSYTWMQFGQLVQQTVEFRRAVYSELGALIKQEFPTLKFSG